MEDKVKNSLDNFRLEYQEYETNQFVKVEVPFAFPRMKKLWYNLQDILVRGYKPRKVKK